MSDTKEYTTLGTGLCFPKADKKNVTHTNSHQTKTMFPYTASIQAGCNMKNSVRLLSPTRQHNTTLAVTFPVSTYRWSACRALETLLQIFQKDWSYQTPVIMLGLESIPQNPQIIPPPCGFVALVLCFLCTFL